ncbi:MAG: prepilin-type N-terminal cleavage/methylation domain-containing protein [Leptolyngbyaceae cyanobacterium SL_1_1]|nr:prepilin-type N-terminal cleavage/methylation domain-containing protein [Leptolyngbyaceae cyanobacterium RM1_1_2]NJO11851.1 prepilin-type N-terminal cleavage/methylation domain-containing protein [Leptolyngbyaceae cyanobacterium SL_1_1]
MKTYLNQLNIARNRAGFTLLEMMLVLSMMGTLMAIAAPSLLTLWQRHQVTTAQRQVYKGLRQAQQQAIQSKTEWRFSIRAAGDRVEWTMHPAKIEPKDANGWKMLPTGVLLDGETSLRRKNYIPSTVFDHEGNVSELAYKGRVTLSSVSGGSLKRCVIVSTLLGAMRLAKDQPYPNEDGRYCY